ncbi:MAG: hypothetical protein JKY31_04045, partial [Rhodobacteraceae bacterium]|nr:hypothetical protein [Paracoccaceae bacterium]
MYFDIIMIGDFRFPGGTSTSIASETAILAKAGYRVGLIATAGAVLKYPHPMHPEIRRVLDNGFAELIAPDQSVSCALCLLHHPQVFKQWPHRPWHIEAGQTIMVVHHPLMTASGQPFYDWQKIDTITRDMFGDVRWAPVGPKVREQFSRAVNPPKLFLQDWTNVFDIDEWKVPRTGFMSAQPVIGRHSRPDPLKWPETRSAFFQVYPDDPHFDVRLMGYGTDLEAVVGHPPANWTVLPFKAMPPRDFLGSIDFFVYYHHSEWVEAYGRSILEAMATGAVVVLHPSFRPLFGEGAIYAVPASVQATIRNFHQNPKLFLAQSNRAVDVATEIAGPQVLIDRVAHLIGLPARQKRPAGQVKRPKIMFFTSNGVGMGHLTRSLAVARRLPDSVEPVFLTLSKAFGLVEREGIHAEYLPFHRATGANIDDWNSHLNREVQAAIAFHQPDVFMFDGNVPYYGMLSALEEFPALWRVWMRRGMWAPNSGTTEITRE